MLKRLQRARHRARTGTKTLLVITYDEHGGFFDHVVAAGGAGRRPAVSPLRRARARDRRLALDRGGSVSHELFDHTSIIKTILLRFCRQATAASRTWARACGRANHLGAS